MYFFISRKKREVLYPYLQHLQEFQEAFRRKRLKMVCITDYILPGQKLRTVWKACILL